MKRILIMDDNARLALLWKETFELNENYSVTLCHNTAAALGFLKIEPFDLVITDLFVPDSSGGLGVLLHTFKMGKSGPPVIAVTGERMPSIMSDEANVYLAQANRLGAVRTMEKPFPAAELFLAAEKVLKSNQGR